MFFRLTAMDFVLQNPRAIKDRPYGGRKYVGGCLTPPTHCRIGTISVPFARTPSCHSEGEARGNLLVKWIVSDHGGIGAHLLLPPYRSCLSGDCHVGFRPPRNDSGSRWPVALKRNASVGDGVLDVPGAVRIRHGASQEATACRTHHQSASPQGEAIITAAQWFSAQIRRA